VSRITIRAVVLCVSQRTCDPLDPVDTNGIDQRISAYAHKGFDELRQGVEAGQCGDFRRQVVCQRGIHHCDPLQHQRASQTRFDAVRGRSEIGITGDFAAGAGRGRHCNERQRRNRDRAAISHCLDKLERLA